jgi:hypothetical protein
VSGPLRLVAQYAAPGCDCGDGASAVFLQDRWGRAWHRVAGCAQQRLGPREILGSPTRGLKPVPRPNLRHRAAENSGINAAGDVELPDSKPQRSATSLAESSALQPHKAIGRAAPTPGQPDTKEENRVRTVLRATAENPHPHDAGATIAARHPSGTDVAGGLAAG